MRDPHSAIPEEATPQLWRRYDEWRGNRYLRFNERNAHKLPTWRNRRTYRKLVLALLGMLLVLLVAAVLAFFTMPWFFIPFFLGLLGVVAVLQLLRIVTGSYADTPVSALDEIQLAQRNAARSAGLFVMFALMFIPYLILIILGSQDRVDGQLVYGTAILLVVLMLTAMCVPTMLASWWMSDPDPEDVPHSLDPHTSPERNPNR